MYDTRFSSIPPASASRNEDLALFLRVALRKPRLLHPVVPELGKREKCPLPRTENPWLLAASSSLKSGMKYPSLLMLVSFSFYLHINSKNLSILGSNVAVLPVCF